MKARGKGSIGFAGNGNGGLYQSSGRNAFDGGRDGASSDDATAAAAKRKRQEALAKLEAFGKQKAWKKMRKRVVCSSPSSD